MKNVIQLVAVAAFATSSFTMARANAAFEPRSETVRFADLDTTNIRGTAVLFARLRFAAENVCRDLEPGRQLALRQAYAACVRTAITKAVAEIHRPALTAYAVSRGFPTADGAITVAINK